MNYFADMIAAKYNPCLVTLNAQIQTVEFYEKCGFVKEGKEFLEAGIKHIKMNKVYK